MHTNAERTTMPRIMRQRIASLALALAATGLVLSGCSGSQPTDPAGEPALGTVEQKLAAEMERLEVRESNAEEELEGAQQDWSLYQQGWPAYQATYPEANEDLLRCAPLRFAGEAKIIGPDGGTIQMGVHQLVVPQGALTEDVVITGELTTGPLLALDLSPHGLVFQKPVLLRLAYDHCQAAQVAADEEEEDGDGEDGDGDSGDGDSGDGSGGGATPAPSAYRIVHVDLDESVLEQFTSTDAGAAIEAWLDHFSRYALMY